MSEDKKVIHCVAVPDACYKRMMKNLKTDGIHYVFDKDGGKEEVRLIDGKPMEISTNREIKSMTEIQKSCKDIQINTMWGRLMQYGELIHTVAPFSFFKVPPAEGYCVYDSNKDKIVGMIMPEELGQFGINDENKK